MTAILRNVPKTFTFDEQRVEINEIAQDLYDLRLASAGTTSFSVTTGAAVSGGGLSYDNTTGIFTFNPTDVSSFLTSFTETDPIFVASPAYGITSTNITNWNNAHSWGDHSLEGYLKAADQSDWNATSGLAEILNKPTIFSGSYTDLTNKPTLFSGSYTDLTNKPTLVTNINDLGDVDTTGIVGGKILQSDANGTWVIAALPAAQVQSNWNELDTAEASYIQNKPAIPTIPNNVSAFNNDAGYLTTYTDTNTTYSLDSSNENTDDVKLTLVGSNSTTDSVVITKGTNITFSDVTTAGFKISATGGLPVNVSGANAPNDGQVLKWVQSASEWQPANDLTASGGGVNVLQDLNDVVYTGTSDGGGPLDVGDVLSWNGSNWTDTQLAIPSIVSELSDVANASPSDGDALLWDAGNSLWVPGAVSGGGGGSSSILYANVASFPVVANSKSKFAYADDTGIMYYSNGVSWTSQRLVTTNSTTSSDFATLLGNTQLTYSINVVDFTTGTTAENLARKIIRLEDSSGTTDQIVLVAGTGLTISDSGDEIQIDLTADIANSTYSISAETAAGNADSVLRLTDNAGTADNITFAGADGLLVERTDANTLTFRAPSGASGGSYTTEDAQDAAALLFSNGTHSNITFTYDDNNNSISAAVTGGGGGGTTYDLLGSNTTSNNAILTLRDAANNDDTIEFTGSNGTDITWDSANKKVTINSTAPVQSDWDATTGLAQILNKPSIPSAYTLPAATTSTLGGVIPDGTTITLDASGNISAVAGGYTLPIAAAGTLGGIKVGSGLSIDGNGVLTATGGSSVPQIQDLTGTTASIADDATAELNITGYKAYSLFKIEVDAAAWVRVYTDDTSRDADQTRSEGADPSPGSGVIAEVRTTTAESILITPGIMGFNNDSPRTTTIYLSVTNRSGGTSTVTVTLTALQIGE